MTHAWQYCTAYLDTAGRRPVAVVQTLDTEEVLQDRYDASLGETIALLGHSGWELVSAIPGKTSRNSTMFYFKRPIPQAGE